MKELSYLQCNFPNHMIKLDTESNQKSKQLKKKTKRKEKDNKKLGNKKNSLTVIINLKMTDKEN